MRLTPPTHPRIDELTLQCGNVKCDDCEGIITMSRGTGYLSQDGGANETANRLAHPRSPIMSNSPRSWRRVSSSTVFLALSLLLVNILITPVQAVRVPFENCLPKADRNKQGLERMLQWTPTYVDAKFDLQNDSHPLMVTVYGDVSGSMSQKELPPPVDEKWNDNQSLLGKIENLPEPKTKYTGLKHIIGMLSYEPWSQNVNFCDNLNGITCPLGPAFDADE